MNQPQALLEATPAADAHLAVPTACAIAADTPDLDAIYAQLVEALCDVLHCASAAVLYPAESSMRVCAQFGAQALPAQVATDAQAARMIARLCREQRAIGQWRAAPFTPPLPAPTSDLAWIGLPIIFDRQLYACVSLTGRFRRGDKQVALALVKQSVGALALFQRARAAERQSSASQQMLQLEQRLHRDQNQDTALDEILAVAMAYTGATHGSIVVTQQHSPLIIAQRGYTQAEATLLQQIPPSLERGLTARVYQTHGIAVSDDTQGDPQALPILSQTRSQLVIPLCAGEEVRGLIDLQSPQLAAFHASDEQWLLLLGSITADMLDRHSVSLQSADPTQIGAAPHNRMLLSSRLAIVSDLAAGVAHEINNPLTSMLGYTHLLLRDQSLAQATRDDLEQIIVEGQRIVALVKRFLYFAQPTASGKQLVSIKEPLRAALAILNARLDEGNVRVTFDAPAEPLMVMGQPIQLEQAFLDVLQNAVEAMSTANDRQLRIQISKQDDVVRVAIADTGQGIAPAVLSHVFEPGMTTKVVKGVSRGLGLGLYAAHTIMQEHWGWIEIQSQVHAGSTFTFCLPAI